MHRPVATHAEDERADIRDILLWKGGVPKFDWTQKTATST